MMNWAKSVDAAMPIPRKIEELKDFNLRNAYEVILETDYNPRTSVRHLDQVMIYAELAGNGNCKNSEIKSFEDNNLRDLAEHASLEGQAAGIVNEQSFLRILPDTLDDFLDAMKEVSSVNFLVGPQFSNFTGDGAADGTFFTDHPERFTIDQKVVVDDDNSAPATGFVARADGINMNTKDIHLVTARGGVSDLDISAYTTAQNAKAYVDGAETAGQPFTSLAAQLLSAINGGDTNLFGEDKLKYPYLQATNISGTAITATNILEEIFDAWTTVQQLGRGRLN